jgi:lipid A 3-O-deacylase
MCSPPKRRARRVNLLQIHSGNLCLGAASRIVRCLTSITLMRRLIGIAVCLLLALSFAAAQDRPEEGGHELQVWTGGGRSVPGGTKDTSVWNAGVRYGWILTAPHGPGFLNGRFEYAVDAVPAFVVIQPANTTYGAGVNPLGLKWIFATRSDVEPYLELNGGTLFTTHEVPTGTSTINFTSSAALGIHILREHAWTLEVRYMHISNAGLTTPNPGINTVQVRLGFGKFFGRK